MRLQDHESIIDPPAINGGRPAFAEGLPLARPDIPSPTETLEDLNTILQGNTITNGSFVRELEAKTAEYIGVRHCVAVSSCTTGLMLLLRAVGISGDVIVPSFTFAATVHAVVWNGLRPVFADIDPQSLTLSPKSVQRAAGLRTAAILGTHIYGNPCDIEGLESVARTSGIHLFFDAAHAFGSTYRGTAIGRFGDAEVFSLSPTKLLVAGEGGIIATNDDALAERLRIGRDYGNPGNYDCKFVGLNARMSELHAAVALGSLKNLEERVIGRNALAAIYRRELGPIPGIRFPEVRAGDRSTYKDFTIIIDEEEFGMNATRLAAALSAEGVETRRYYSPPVHKMEAYRTLPGSNSHLPVTEAVADQVLTLPMWGQLTEAQIVLLAEAIRRIRVGT